LGLLGTGGNNIVDASRRQWDHSGLADYGGEVKDEPMTLCIAAECDHEDKPAIVCCWDWRAQHGSEGELVIGTDDLDKMRDIGSTTVLLAGSRSKADELIMAAKPAIQRANEIKPGEDYDTDIRVDALLKGLREAARKLKTEAVEHFVQMETGIPFADFRKQARYEETDTWLRVRGLTLDADLIVSFVADSPQESVVISVNRYGDVAWRANNWAIGEGAMVARSLLAMRPWEQHAGLAECLFRVYEAKRAAHLANPQAVGAETSIQVLLPSGKKTVTDECMERMKDIFALKHRWPHDERLGHLTTFQEGWLRDGPAWPVL
jgi:hypothetical protein